MPEPQPVVDVEALLAPISEERPCGEDQYYTGVRDELKSARTTDEDQSRENARVADFRLTKELAIDALSNKAKDLQFAAWLTEALTRLHGIAGLRDGFKVIGGLHERYWDGYYPELDEGDSENRARCLADFDGIAASALLDVVIAKAGPLTKTVTHLVSANRTLRAPEREEDKPAYEQAKAELEEAKSQIEEAKEKTPRAFYEDAVATVDACLAAYQVMDKAIDVKFGAGNAPSLRQLKTRLDEVKTFVTRALAQKKAQEGDGASAGEEGEGEATEGTGSGGGKGQPKGRQEALQRLRDVAAWFKRNEPHSPVPFLVERAVIWAEKPFDFWLQDILKDGAALEQIRESIGIRTIEAAESAAPPAE